jgi:hypothetical protein
VSPGGIEARVRAVAWAKDSPFGAEHARIELGADSLVADGVAIGSSPVPYRLTYQLAATEGFITERVVVTADGEGWRRSLELERNGDGTWSARASRVGSDSLGPIGGETAAVRGALDADLGLSPAFNTMPVLRHGLLDGGRAPDLVMAWISVPDLAVRRSEQRYTALEHDGPGVLIRFETIGDEEPFVADIVFDEDGLVVDYPDLARRLR